MRFILMAGAVFMLVACGADGEPETPQAKTTKAAGE